MTSATRYATRAELRQRLDATDVESYGAAEDAIHEAVLDAVSAAIDDYCGQTFYLTATGTTRYYTAEWSDVLVVPPLVSVDASGLQTDDNGTGTYGTTWASTDFTLWPWNAAAEVPARPYTEIRVDERSTSTGNTFPTGQRGVKVTGAWGWPAVPPQVREVCILESLRMLQQLQAPSGVVASAEMGEFVVMPQLHPTSAMMLRPFRRMTARVAVGR
jgi:hypothetical protein